MCNIVNGTAIQDSENERTNRAKNNNSEINVRLVHVYLIAECLRCCSWLPFYRYRVALIESNIYPYKMYTHKTKRIFSNGILSAWFDWSTNVMHTMNHFKYLSVQTKYKIPKKMGKHQPRDLLTIFTRLSSWIELNVEFLFQFFFSRSFCVTRGLKMKEWCC